MTETWDIWYPNAASRGLHFARAAIAPATRLLVHATPDTLRVEVSGEDGNRIAFGDQLAREGDSFPMTRLVREGGTVRREDGWPVAEDIGCPVILPGGEAGILREWWNAEDGSAWRWNVEFSNQR